MTAIASAANKLVYPGETNPENIIQYIYVP